MSKMLEKARKYEDEQGKQIKAEDRPAFHVSPYVGWMNDPNGFSYMEQYDEEDDAEESRDGIAETLVRWVPPITAIVCAGIALWGFVYYQFMM